MILKKNFNEIINIKEFQINLKYIKDENRKQDIEPQIKELLAADLMKNRNRRFHPQVSDICLQKSERPNRNYI